MADVVLFHSALGLTSHLDAWVTRLQGEGHRVVAPDLFGGRTFTDLDAAVDFVDAQGGPPAFVDAALAGAAPLTGARVYMGFSLGGAVAETLALTQPDARGLVIMHGAMSPAWIGVTQWPDGLSAQLHYAADDPWVEPDENAAFLDLAQGACEEFVYPGSGHLFAFEGWTEHDAKATDLLMARVSSFLTALNAPLLLAPELDRGQPLKGPASYFPGIQARYSRPMQEWIDLVVRELPGRQHMEVVRLLKEEHGVGHGHANAMVAWVRAELDKR
jgi:dienelactone hydrolase